MGTKEDVLKILINNADNFISGETLAKKLSKSRAAVWKAIKALQKQGYVIDAVTNKGYRLNEQNDIITQKSLKEFINFDADILYYPIIDSTNNEAKRLVSNGSNRPMLIVAEEQTNGRGRQGKSFYSPPLTGIYMTLVTHPMSKLTNAVTATTAASVAVCKAVEELTDLKPKIKWVNDVYLDDKKICGILTEAITDFETQTVSSVVIGIGMNIKTIHFPDEVENAASLNVNISRVKLIAQIANNLNRILCCDYGEFIDYYISHSMIIGEKINFIKGSKITPATAIDIDSTGGLVVELENGKIATLRSGEISIRKRN